MLAGNFVSALSSGLSSVVCYSSGFSSASPE
jgi:hypothetical protein